MEVRRSASGEFVGDLGLAVRAWAQAPLLPLASLLLATPSFVGVALADERGALALGLSFVSLIFLGWLGVERIWYLRAFREERLSLREAWSLNLTFWPRFFALAIIVFLSMLPIYALIAFVSGLSTPAIAAIPAAFVDVTLTFVTASLAFSTRQPAEAIRLGLTMLRTELPHAVWYAVVPAIVGSVSFLSFRQEIEGTTRLALAALVLLLDLAFKGTIAAYYLRRHDVGDRGSADLPPGTWAADRSEGSVGRDTTLGERSVL